MIPLHVIARAATLFLVLAFSPLSAQQPVSRPPITIVTDGSWEVSGRQVRFGEYPLPAEQIASATSPLYGGSQRAVEARHNGRGKIVPGSLPIWRNQTADGEGEAYQLRKTLRLGADPIRRATLEVNCDDVARVYINKRLASVDQRDGKLKDGYDEWFLFRSVSGFMYNRIYTYDVTDYFFTNVENSIFVEAVSLAFDGSHAYFSAKIVLEFDPLPGPPPPVQRKAAAPKAKTPPAPAPDKIVFEAGGDPGIEQLRVGSIIELGHVYFEADQARLDTASYRTLAALAAFLKRYPRVKIEVGGHTNLRPGERFAAQLSAERAATVRDYLLKNGVAPERITYKGYGKSRPRIPAISAEADRANQRVEATVLGL